MKVINVKRDIEYFLKIIIMPTYGNEGKLGCENRRRVTDRINIRVNGLEISLILDNCWSGCSREN